MIRHLPKVAWLLYLSFLLVGLICYPSSLGSQDWMFNCHLSQQPWQLCSESQQLVTPQSEYPTSRRYKYVNIVLLCSLDDQLSPLLLLLYNVHILFSLIVIRFYIRFNLLFLIEIFIYYCLNAALNRQIRTKAVHSSLEATVTDKKFPRPKTNPCLNIPINV